jgi:hypothetical protein
MTEELSQLHTFSSLSHKFCDYCHRENHIREICWDLHGRSIRGWGRDRDRRGSKCQQTHMADTASQLGPSLDDMLTQLMIQLAARLTSITSASVTAPIASSSRANGYNISSLLTTVVKPIGTIMKALVAELSVDVLDCRFWGIQAHDSSPHNVQNL